MRFNHLKNQVTQNKRFLLPIGVIISIMSVCVVYFLFAIAPAFKDLDKLTSQLTDTRKASLSTQKSADQDPKKLNARLGAARTNLDTALTPLMSQSEASQIAKIMYGYAQDSGVTITDLQANQPQKQVEAYRVTNYRIQVQGNSRSLVDFVSRIKETSSQSFVMTNLTLAGTEDKASLTLEFGLYAYPDALRETQH